MSIERDSIENKQLSIDGLSLYVVYKANTKFYINTKVTAIITHGGYFCVFLLYLKGEQCM